MGVDAETLDARWAVAKTSGDLVKFGGGFYVAKLATPPLETAVVPMAGGILPQVPRSLYSDEGALALPGGAIDESEKM